MWELLGRRTTLNKKNISMKEITILVQLHSLAPNTLKCYLSAAKNFFEFATRSNWNCGKLSGDQVALYLVHRWYVDKNKCESIKTSLSNIKNFYRYFQEEFPDDDQEMKDAIDGISRLDISGTRHATPISGYHLSLLEKHFTGIEFNHARANEARKRLDVDRLQFITLLAIAQNGLLRISEVLCLRWDHIVRIDNGYRVTIDRSKANKKGGSENILLVNHDSDHTSAATWLSIYAKVARDPDDEYVFETMDGESKLTARYVNNMIKQYAAVIGFDKKEVSSHSLRSGGATDLSRSGMSRENIMKHGRWKSSAMVDLYNRPNEDDWSKTLLTSYQTMGKATRGNTKPPRLNPSEQQNKSIFKLK